MQTSNQKTYDITCPQCKTSQEVDLYECLDVGEAPELKEKILGNQINQVSCPSCGHAFRVDKTLLYKDLQKKALILLIPADPLKIDLEDDDSIYQQLSALCGMLPEGMAAPAFHVVHSRVELVERIFMLDEGLDERVVEYIKYLMYTRNPEQLNPAQKALLFNAPDSNEEQLCFVMQNVENQLLEGLLHYDRKAYDALNEMFDCDDHTPDLLEIFPGPYINARTLLLKENGHLME